MPYPSPADEERNGGCALPMLALVLLVLIVYAIANAANAFGAQEMTVSPARTDGPIYDLPSGVDQTIVCDSYNREYLLLTTANGGVYLMPYTDEDGNQAIMPQA